MKILNFLIPLGACIPYLLPPAHATTIGDRAPVLAVERWIKGTPVAIQPGTNTYVVEFWATWCGPCKESIPHLTSLQQKYAPQSVIFIGISDEPADDVAPFVAAQGNNMNYHVAIDTSRRTYKWYMNAFGQNGIPHAFIINTNGIIAWHGHPADNLENALDHILAGTFNIEFEKKKETADRLIDSYQAQVSRPNAAAKAAPLGDKILSDYAVTWVIPYSLAELILTDTSVRSRDLDLALRATTKAVDMTRHSSYQALAMHARALFAKGNKSEAVETQKQAIQLCNQAEDKPELEKFLALYQKAAQ